MAIPLAAIGAAATAVAPAASSLISNSGSKRSQKRANKYNVEMYNRQRADALLDYDKQRSHNLHDYATQRADALSDWRRENDYNSPASQMLRYKDAGLNPNLIYGEGVSASSGMADNVRSTETRGAETRGSSYGNSQAARYNMDFGMGEFALMQAQVDLLHSQAEKNRADAGQSSATEQSIRTMLPINHRTGEINMDLMRSNISKIASDILVNAKDIDSKTQQIIESDARITKMYQDTLVAWAEYQNAVKRTGILETEARTGQYNSYTGRMNAHTNALNAKTNIFDAKTRRSELGVHQADAQTRHSQLMLNRDRLEFDKKKQTFDDAMRQAGISSDETSNLFRMLNYGIRIADDGLGSLLGYPTINAPRARNYFRPDY